MVWVIVLFCAALFVFMKLVGGAMGESIGTAAGVGCLGLIAFGIIAAITLVLLPFLLPLLVFGLIAGAVCYIGYRVTQLS